MLSRQAAYQNLFPKTVLVLSLRGNLVPVGKMIETSPQIHMVLTRTLDGLIVISPLALRTITDAGPAISIQRSRADILQGRPKAGKAFED